MTTPSPLLLLKVSFLVISFFSFFFAAPVSAKIPSGLELNGYAWSSNIGWISLNCKTGGINKEDICDTTSNYKVKVNSNRNLYGYAWSPNIGWVRFGNLESMSNHPGFPSGGETDAVSARLADDNYTDTTLEGWVRACAGTNSNLNSCSNGAQSSVSGGWDGWISLRGNRYSIKTKDFGTPQYAWGSTVVGWVDMSTHVDWLSPTTLTGTGCTISTAGENTCDGKLTWSFKSDVVDPTIVRTLPTTPKIADLTGESGENRPVTLQLGKNTFSARSTASGVNIVSRILIASCDEGLGLLKDETSGTCQLPTPEDVIIVSLTAKPSIVRRGGTAQIEWQLSAVPSEEQCKLSGPSTNQVITGQNGSITTHALTATARFTLDCGASEKDVVITVVPAFNEV